MKSTHHCPDQDVEFALSCPSMSYLFPGNNNYAQDIRSPLANLVANKCPTRKGSSSMVRKLHASDFQSSNADHMQLVKAMGISIVNLPDGRVQLLHTIANAKTPEDGEEGLLFMQEMIDLSKQPRKQMILMEIKGNSNFLFLKSLINKKISSIFMFQ